jgi:serine/threonine protein kinase
MRGAVAEVWKLQLAEDCPGAPQQLALKMLLYRMPSKALEPEVITLNQLRLHPNTIQLYGSWEGGVPWLDSYSTRNGLILEYCSGGTASMYCRALVERATAAAAAASAAAAATAGAGGSAGPTTRSQAAASSSQVLHGQGKVADPQQETRQTRGQQQRAGATQPTGPSNGAALTSADAPPQHARRVKQQGPAPVVLLRLRTLEELLRVQFTDLLVCLMKLHANLGMAPPPAAAIYHLDIKPANLLVDGTGTFKLGDWGLSRVVSAENVATARPTAGGTLP